MADEYVWDVAWPELRHLDAMLEEGWEPFGFVLYGNQPVIGLKKLVLREDTIKYPRRTNFPGVST